MPLGEQVTPEEAKEVLAKEQAKRMAAFQQELDALCKKYKVRLDVVQNIVVSDAS